MTFSVEYVPISLREETVSFDPDDEPAYCIQSATTYFHLTSIQFFYFRFKHCVSLLNCLFDHQANVRVRAHIGDQFGAESFIFFYSSNFNGAHGAIGNNRII